MENSELSNSKDAFYKYLQDNGVIEQLSRVLVGLYEESDRPLNALEYIKKFLGAPPGVEVEELKEQVLTLKRENEALERKVEALQNQLDTIKREMDE